MAEAGAIVTSWLTPLWIGFASRPVILPMSCMKAGPWHSVETERWNLLGLRRNRGLENPSVGIRELLGPDWYYRDAGPVYSVGGAFVDFLIRTRGAASFRRFYTECQPKTVEAKCQEIFETDLDHLEAEFWEDVQKALRNHGTDK